MGGDEGGEKSCGSLQDVEGGRRMKGGMKCSGKKFKAWV